MELNLILGISVLGLLFAVYLMRDVLRRDTGPAAMREISDAIKQGAEAFLRRQNRTIAYIAVALAALIYILYAFVRTPTANDPASPGQLALWTTLSFVLGAACSVAAGYMGMWVAIRSNIRTAVAATRTDNKHSGITPTIGVISPSPSPSPLVDLEAETNLSVNVGGGVKKYFTDRCGIRFDFRSYISQPSGDTVNNMELSFGLIFKL
ncbi:MAG: sodium/proton-translocating pyrophosphatase [Acidobacteria bacterium]|nr:sodium/proton-translocating pyrophosphatase [Acidobacteriota bacterium]